MGHGEPGPGEPDPSATATIAARPSQTGADLTGPTGRAAPALCAHDEGCHPAPAWLRHLSGRVARPVAAVAVAGGLAALVWSQHATIGRSLGTLGAMRWQWAVLAVAAESASMATFARVQRRLLRAGGVRLAMTSALAITYSGNAISVSLPLAGSELGTAFAFREYQRHGADAGVVGWALVVSGVVSAVTFAVVIAGGAIASGNTTAAALGLAGGLTTLVPVAVVLLSLRRPRLRARLERGAAAAVRFTQRVVHRPAGDAATIVADAVRRVGGLRLRRRDWALLAFFGLVNWVADIACLGLAIHAVGAIVPWRRLVLAWSAGAGAASVGVIPGGIGVVEAALAVALVGAGLHSRTAVASALLYRLISFWLVLGLGWLFYAVTRRRPPATDRAISLEATAATP